MEKEAKRRVCVVSELAESDDFVMLPEVSMVKDPVSLQHLASQSHLNATGYVLYQTQLTCLDVYINDAHLFKKYYRGGLETEGSLKMNPGEE